MRKIIMQCGIFMTTFFLCGCAHYSTNNNFFEDLEFRMDFAMEHDEFPPDVRQAIVEGKILPGMNQDLIRTIFGDPEETYMSETEMFEMWYYENFTFGFDKNGNLVTIFESDNIKHKKQLSR